MAENTPPAQAQEETSNAPVSQEETRVPAWDKIDAASIPENVLKSHPAYKELLGESISRRQTIASMKKQLSQISSDEPQEESEESSDNNNPDYAEIRNELKALKEMIQQKDSVETRNKVAQEHNIPENMVKYIHGDDLSAMQESAKELAQAFGTNVRTVSSTNASQTSRDRVEGIIKRSMEIAEDFNKAPSILGAEAALRSGGGVVNPLENLMNS